MKKQVIRKKYINYKICLANRLEMKTVNSAQSGPQLLKELVAIAQVCWFPSDLVCLLLTSQV